MHEIKLKNPQKLVFGARRKNGDQVKVVIRKGVAMNLNRLA